MKTSSSIVLAISIILGFVIHALITNNQDIPRTNHHIKFDNNSDEEQTNYGDFSDIRE